MLINHIFYVRYYLLYILLQYKILFDKLYVLENQYLITYNKLYKGI